MIEKLEPTPHPYFAYCNSAPDNWMLMEKINELVEAVNRMEQQIEKLQVI